MIHTDGKPTICSPEVAQAERDAARDDNVAFLDLPAGINTAAEAAAYRLGLVHGEQHRTAS